MLDLLLSCCIVMKAGLLWCFTVMDMYQYIEGLCVDAPFSATGLSHWHKQRQEWVGRQKPQQRKLREPVIKYDQHVSA
jgi:hypothetical protein